MYVEKRIQNNNIFILKNSPGFSLKRIFQLRTPHDSNSINDAVNNSNFELNYNIY